MNKIIKHETVFNGVKVVLESGKLASQADAAVVATVGETTVLVTVVSKPATEATDFLPLKIDYEERYYAGGILSGSKYTRREGRPTDEAVVHGRLLDHAIRPLFPKDFADDTQLIITVLSSDDQNSPILAGFLGTSAALSISGLPFNGPIVPLRISKNDGVTEFSLATEKQGNDMDLVVSYIKDGHKIQALEASANIIPEAEVVEAIKKGGEISKELFVFLNEFAQMAKVPVREYKKSWINKEFIALLTPIVMPVIEQMLANKVEYNTKEWYAGLDVVAKEIIKTYPDYSEMQINTIIGEIQKNWVRDTVLVKNSRIDGRKDDEIRPLSAEVGILPRVHGSGLFSRGLTQALTIATLGPLTEKLLVQGMHGEVKKGYIHHYNFPPFSTGEIGKVGNANRRSIGHGMLAEKALVPVLPTEAEFPYTIRLVSEITSSNGSTSMASTCGSSLALMDAGVPIKAHVAGIGVGLFVNKEKEDLQLSDYKLLTDIMGVEDFAGYMDFKLTGTKDGMTAIQLELKVQGLPLELLDKVFEVSKAARLKVLEVMNTAIGEPRKELNKNTPKIEIVRIAKDQIGMVIGSGGSTIRALMEETGAQIDVEEDAEGGMVSIMASSQEILAKTKDIIVNMTKVYEVGDIMEGEVSRIEPYGCFVYAGGKNEGLVHISEFAHDYVDDIRRFVKLGDIIKAKVISTDNGKISLSVKALTPRPEQN